MLLFFEMLVFDECNFVLAVVAAFRS